MHIYGERVSNSNHEKHPLIMKASNNKSDVKSEKLFGSYSHFLTRGGLFTDGLVIENLKELIFRGSISIVLISFSRQEEAHCCKILFWYRAADVCRDLMNNDKDFRVGQLTRRKKEQSHKVKDTCLVQQLWKQNDCNWEKRSVENKK